MTKRKVKVLKYIGLYKAGDTPLIEIDGDGQPKQRFWRNRFKDADVEWDAQSKKKLTAQNNKEEKQ